MITDPAERERLARKWSPLVYHLANRRAARGDLQADDLVSDGFLGLVSALNDYDPGRGASFGTWVYLRVRQSVWAAAAHLLRHRERYGSLEDVDAPSLARDAPEPTVEILEELARARKAVTRTEWRLLWRYHALGMTLAEIGRREGVGRAAVSARKIDIMNRVREKLGIELPVVNAQTASQMAPQK